MIELVYTGKLMVMARISHQKCWLSAALFFIALLISQNVFAQSIFIVSSTRDSGDVDLADQICADSLGNCTLRAAIENANKTSATDSIRFSIKGKGPFYIYVRENLPEIVEPVVLDATTQEGYHYMSPQIVVSGERIVPVFPPSQREEDRIYGFRLGGQSSGSVIRGFALGNFGFKDYRIRGEVVPFYLGYAILAATDNNKIQGNFIGLAPDGITPIPNFWGIADLGMVANLIGGKRPETRNVISGNYRIGVFVKFKSQVIGNYIGTDVTGKLAVGNEQGISLPIIASKNHISHNLVSGNKNGIAVAGKNNIIENNLVGINSTGTEALPNDIGISVDYSVQNVIGAGNVISGNRIGIKFHDAYANSENNKIQGNYIGTDVTGTYAIPNGTGILLHKGSFTLVGGEKAEHRNIISGNMDAGVKLSHTTNNIISNNYIGTSSRGDTALPNGWGILFEGSAEEELNQNNIIRGNLISGNTRDGILLKYSMHTSVFNNKIGVGRQEEYPLANGGSGIYIRKTAIANCIGGKDFAGANIIGFNQEHGIRFEEEDELPSFYASQIFHNRLIENCRTEFSPLSATPQSAQFELLTDQ